ncbi:MAG: tryptophan-rich sensory protein [Bacteroidetes bacterium]|nr:tryptophan-rich sensory protein [Bacteroidota bacterium]
MAIKKNAPSYIKLFFAILACEGVGLLSGLISGNEVNTWFPTSNTPSWNPPAFLFPSVWATLYFLMAISLYIIWTKIKIQPQKNNALILFGIQLTLNFLWSIIFFRFHSPLIALLDIVLLFVAIFITILNFSRYSKLAAWLMVPYFAWVTFATILNFSIWYFNR